MGYAIVVLLFAGLIALMIWNEKEEQRLIQWGNEMHDSGKWTLEELIEWQHYLTEHSMGRAL